MSEDIFAVYIVFTIIALAITWKKAFKKGIESTIDWFEDEGFIELEEY